MKKDFEFRANTWNIECGHLTMSRSFEFEICLNNEILARIKSIIWVMYYAMEEVLYQIENVLGKI